MQDPITPCVRICKLNEEGTFCIGCGRTLNDLKRWARLSNEERQKRTQEAAARLQNN